MYHLPHLERVIGLRPDQRPRPERGMVANLLKFLVLVVGGVFVALVPIDEYSPMNSALIYSFIIGLVGAALFLFVNTAQLAHFGDAFVIFMRLFDAIFELAILRRHSLCDLVETTFVLTPRRRAAAPSIPSIQFSRSPHPTPSLRLPHQTMS